MNTADLTVTSAKAAAPVGIADNLRTFVINNFMYGESAVHLANSESFLDKGIIDSTGVLELVAFIQDRYGITIQDEELIPDNLDSIDNLVRFIEDKLTTDAATASEENGVAS